MLVLQAIARDVQYSGQTYIITDDTPLHNTYDLLHHFLQLKGMRASNTSLPFEPIYCLLKIFEAFVWIMRPLVAIDVPATPGAYYYACHSFHFNRSKAESLLGYKSLYSPDEAFQLSDNYYRNVEL